MLLGSWQKPSIGAAVDTRPPQNNFSTVAIVPVSDDVPLTAFTYELYHSLCAIGRYACPLSCGWCVYYGNTLSK